MILEEILSEVGRNNNLSDFPAKLGFDEANTRLVNYNKASKQKEEKVRFWRSPAFRGGSSVIPSHSLCRSSRRRPRPGSRA